MDILARHAAAQPDKAAVIDGERGWTWRDYHERRNRLARALTGLGLVAGEHAVIYAHNCGRCCSPRRRCARSARSRCR